MEHHTRLHKIFEGTELKTAERIQHLRYLMLIHSRIYYKLNYNLLSDKDFDMLAKELRDLQNANPAIAGKVDFAEAFADWDASTGAFLPLDDEWVVKKTSLIFSRGAGRGRVKDVREAAVQQTHPVPAVSKQPVEETPVEEKPEESKEDYQLSLEDLFDMEL